jgi:predicted nucleic acid-binding protein
MAKKGRKRAAAEFVLDCSMALAWCFPDEKAPEPQAVLDSMAAASAVVPSLWHLEVGNALLVGERKKRCSQADTVSWQGFLGSLPIIVDAETALRAWSDVLNLARTHDLSAYDAAYLELALRRGRPLASLDTKLNAAAAAAGVPMYTP